jgi:hypothetical protein
MRLRNVGHFGNDSVGMGKDKEIGLPMWKVICEDSNWPIKSLIWRYIRTRVEVSVCEYQRMIQSELQK